MDDKEKQPQPDVEKNAPVDQKPAEEVQVQASEAKKPEEKKTEGQKSGAKPFTQRQQRQPNPKEDGGSEFIEKVIKISRVSKVTKGGKKLSFSALVVVGDGKGHVGYYLGKANEVASAIKKAIATAKKNMITVPMKKEAATIPHEIHGVCSGALVMLKPAAEGTGVIASGPVRAVCDAAGIHNILTKCHRSNNPVNVVKATIDGFSRLKTREAVTQQN